MHRLTVACIVVVAVGLASASAAHPGAMGFCPAPAAVCGGRSVFHGAARATSPSKVGLRMSLSEEPEDSRGWVKRAASGLQAIGLAAFLSLNLAISSPADAMPNTANDAPEAGFLRLAAGGFPDLGIDMSKIKIPDASQVMGSLDKV